MAEVKILNKTPLYNCHLAAGAKMVPFCSWSMPINYGSQIEEHNAVRQNAGMFDVSHMAIFDIKGPEVQKLLRFLLANDISKLKGPGRAQYTLMLNESGGVIDDLLVYYIDDQNYRIVSNAGTHDKVAALLSSQVQNFDVKLTEDKDSAIIAIQGPKACKLAHSVLPDQIRDVASALKFFQCAKVDDYFISRTGYTGEDGFEIIIPADKSEKLWNNLLNVGVNPAGLGARDTLRLEAGLNLYGNDMDESTTPDESNLSWVVSFDDPDRNFIGRSVIENKEQTHKLVGLVFQGAGILRAHQKLIHNEQEIGEITSGSYSPTLEFSVAMARIPVAVEKEIFVNIRGKHQPVKLVSLPFVRRGEVVYKEL